MFSSRRAGNEGPVGSVGHGWSARSPFSRKLRRHSPMKKVDVPQSGKLGDVAASKNHSGPYHRKHSPPKTKPTAAQDYTQGEFRVVAKAWGELTDEQYRAWRARARREKSKSKLGKRWTLTAQTYFGRINNPRSAFGKDLLLHPPPPADFPPNPVKRIIITNRAGRITLKIELSGPPVVDIIDRKSTRLNSSHLGISYAVFC